MRNIFVVGLILLLMSALKTEAQEVTARELAAALEECEQDLEASRQQIKSLTVALNATEGLIDERKAVADSLIKSLYAQMAVQKSMIKLFEQNSDTMQVMISDYSTKLDEVSELYKKELRRSSRPWFFTGHGLKGFANGVLIGGVVGIIYVVAKD